jgi:hypothetical protein
MLYRLQSSDVTKVLEFDLNASLNKFIFYWRFLKEKLYDNSLSVAGVQYFRNDINFA